MLAVNVVTRDEEFNALRPEWHTLAESCISSTVFDTFEWQWSWWRVIGRRQLGRSLRIFVFRDEQGQLVGLAPFITSFWHGSLLKRLSFLGSGVSDYHDILAAPGCEDEVAASLYSELRTADFWHIADFNQLRQGGLLKEYSPGPETQLESADREQEECPYLPLPTNQNDIDGWETLLGQFSKKMRGNIRYYARALDRVYTVDRTIVDNAQDLHTGLDSLFALHKRRWNLRWLPGVFNSARIRRFHHTVASELLKQDWLRLHLMKLDGNVEAALYCFKYKSRTYYYQGGFEPELSRLSLGSVITGTAIQQAIQESCEQFDFLRGNEPYKQRWTGGAKTMNIRRIMVHQGRGLMPIASRAYGIEHRIETAFKEHMHKLGSRATTDRTVSARDHS